MSVPPEVVNLDTASDGELLVAHVAGHPDAFTEIVRRHRDRLWAVALKTTGDPEDAA
ncbi:MAG: polymerase sigma factor SigM, partial [Actinomycetota bacterium]